MRFSRVKYVFFTLSFIYSQLAFSQISNNNFEQAGTILQYGIPATAGVIALLHGDKDGFYQLAEGALYNSAATLGIKYAVNAKRPNGGRQSFPSGHTSAATQGAAFLLYRYGWEYGLPAYALAGFVGYSRIESKNHHWRDVFAGALLATGIQYFVTPEKFSDSNFTALPYYDGEQVGLLGSFSW